MPISANAFLTAAVISGCRARASSSIGIPVLAELLSGTGPLRCCLSNAISCSSATTRFSSSANVIPAGIGQNPARQAALKAGLPDTIAAYTVNKVCGSGLKAVMLAAQAIRAGDADLIVAGGMESMSRAPYLLFNARTGWKLGDQKVVDAMVHEGLWCAFEDWHMGAAAEHIATKCSVSRADQDRFAAQSHQRAVAAWEKGAFNAETMPVTIGSGPKAKTVNRDEGMRPETTVDGLGKLKAAFCEG